MPVISSSYALDAHAQADGRRYVREVHTLTVGGPYERSYLAAVGADYQSIMDERVPRINAALAEREAMSNIESEGTPVFNEQTAQEFAFRYWARLFAAYIGGDKYTYHRYVWRGWKWINDGHVTSVQMRNSYNAWRTSEGKPTLDAADWTTMVNTRLIPIKDRYLALIGEGEL